MTLAEAIAKQEGFGNSGNLPTRLNNPGDLTYQGQAGATPYTVIGDDGVSRTFAQFQTPDAGWQALDNQLNLDAGRGLTISQEIAKWAPASDGNNPTGYTANVASWTGLDPSTSVADALAGATSDPSGGGSVDLSSVLGDVASLNPWLLAGALGAGLLLVWAWR